MRAVLLGIWIIGIPLFFLLEWHFLKIEISEPPNKKFVIYKESRELARNLWLAVASFLTLIYFGEYLKSAASEKLQALETQLKQTEQRLVHVANALNKLRAKRSNRDK